MNKILKLSALSLAALFVFAACEDDRENYMAKDGMLLATSSYIDNIANVSVFDGCFETNLYKSGKGTQAADVIVAVDETLVEEYNTKNFTSYKALPTECFSLSRSSFSFTEKEVSKRLAVTWNPAEVLPLLDANNYVIPLRIKDSNLDIWEGTDHILIKVGRPEVNFQRVDLVSNNISFVNNFVDKKTATLVLDSAYETETTVLVSVEPELAAAYNEANGTSYAAAPSRAISLPSSVVVPAGATKVSFEYAVSSAAFYDYFNGAAADTLIAPVCLNSARINGMNINLGAKKTFYVRLNPPAVPSLGFTSETIEEGAYRNPYTEVISGHVQMEFPLPGVDAEIGVTVDNDLVPVYNAAHGTNYIPAPEGFIRSFTKAAIEGGKTTGEFSMKVNCSVVPEGGFSGILIPVKVSSFMVMGNNVGASDQASYIILTPCEGEPRDIFGNKEWDVLEGAELDYFHDPAAESWVSAGFSPVSKMFDGDFKSRFCSFWNTPVTFPQTFVIDMNRNYMPTSFVVAPCPDVDCNGNWSDWEFYMTDEYNGADTKWTLVAKKRYEFTATSQLSVEHDYEVTNPRAGRYVKMVALSSNAYTGWWALETGRVSIGEIYLRGY